jgi:hypothetical protein
VVFEDKFERKDLGEMYDILNPDPNRLTLSDGKLLIVATEPRKNLTLLQQTFPGDFVSSVAVTLQVTENNWVGLYYWVDEDNYLSLGARGEDLQAYITGKGRQPVFNKWVDRQRNQIRPPWRQLGKRELIHFSPRPEIWYLQLQRQGSKYTGRMSVDGVKWSDLGTHALVQKHGRLGLGVRAGKNGIENAAEFDDFVVQR